MKLNILADENIPYVADAFAHLGEVRTVPGRAIDADAVRDADILLVRSITGVDEALLNGSKVRFVATATIGTDHIDEPYLSTAGVGFASAPGSNSNSVAEYVTAALLTWADRRQIELAGRTLGVVGVGHVGSKVVAKAQALGMKVLCNDPPLKRAGGRDGYVSLDELVAVADAITFHVPLSVEGPDPTAHLIDASLLERMKDVALLINSSRGGVHDTAALLAAQEARRQEDRRPLDLVLDVWENEPNIETALLDEALLGTPHIAGYSFDGKVAGTQMIYQAACRHFDIEPTWRPPADLPGPKYPVIEIESAGLSDQQIVRLAVGHAYDIEWDNAALRQISDQPADQQGAYFDLLRKRYPTRREFPAGRVRLSQSRPAAVATLAGLGFNMQP